MNREILIASVGTLLALTSVTGAKSAGNENEKSTLQDLLAENKNLIVQLDKAKKVEGEIAKAGLAVEGTQNALKHAQQELQRKGKSLVGEQQSIEVQGQQSGCPWGGSSKDEAFVDSCNAEGARLNALLKDVQQRKITVNEYSRKLQEEQARLSDSTLKWFAKKKENNADLQMLYDARSDWQQRYNAFVFRSATYERLKKTARGADVCERLSANVNDQALRKASQCLQRLWDGAR